MRGVVRVCVGVGLRYVGVQRGVSYVSLETPDEEYEHYVVSQYCSCSAKKRWCEHTVVEEEGVEKQTKFLEISGGVYVLYGFAKCCLKTRGPRIERG